MNILDFCLVLFFILICTIGFWIGIVKISGISLSLFVASLIAKLLSPLCFVLLQPLFAANELYGQVTCFIAIFAFVTTALQLLIQTLDQPTEREKKQWERVGGSLVAFLLSILVMGLLFLLLSSFTQTCQNSTEGCPNALLVLTSLSDHSFIVTVLKIISKKVWEFLL